MSDPDIDALTSTLSRVATDLLEGRGFAVPVTQILGAVSSGKRLAGKKDAGKQVMRQFFGELLREHPEVIDLAFAGLGEAAKNRIRRALDTPEIKDAEQA